MARLNAETRDQIRNAVGSKDKPLQDIQLQKFQTLLLLDAVEILTDLADSFRSPPSSKKA